MNRTIVSFAAVVLGLSVSFASAQQPQTAQPPWPPPDLSGCWTLTASFYYNVLDRRTFPPYDYMQQLLVDPTTYQNGTPDQMLPKSGPGGLPSEYVLKFKKVRSDPDEYTGEYIRGTTTYNNTNTHWLAHVVKGGTDQEPVYYVPMSAAGPSGRNFSTMANANIQVFAGVADSATHIVGTWVDSRGAMNLTDLNCTDQGPALCSNTGTPHDVSLHTMIFGVQTGRYTLNKIPGRCPQ